MANVNYEELTKGITTKSEKIRTLARAGAPTAEIARFLGIRYQHARNVLVDADLHGGMAEDAPVLETKMASPASLEKGLTVPWDWRYAWVEIDADGTLKLPQHMMVAAGLSAGSTVHVSYESECLEVMSEESAIRRAQALASPFKQEGESVVDDFLIERRLEAKRVEERFDRLEREAVAAALHGKQAS